MAPRRGGGGGGGSTGGGDDGSSSTYSSCDTDWPCTTPLTYIYGNSYTSLYNSGDLLGSLILYSIWLLVLAFLLFSSTCRLRSPQRPVLLILAIVCFGVSYVFLVVRYGLLLGNVDVPIGYRYESSVVVLLQRLGMPCLFLAVTRSLPINRVQKVVLWLGITAYLGLNIAYLVLDFLISAAALDYFKDEWVWRLGDRDFGLLFTGKETQTLTLADGGISGLDPRYIEGRLWEYEGDEGFSNRSVQVKIGVAAAFMALALAVSITVYVGWSWLRRRNSSVRGLAWMFLAATGLLLSAIFATVLNTYFVLWNWGIITDILRWDDWIDSYPSLDYYNIVPPTEFLEGYRIAVDGFPIVEAVLEPLGIVLTSASVYILARIGREIKDLTIPNGTVKT